MNKDLMFSSESGEWSTPQKFFDILNEEFHFTLDPAASTINAKCEKFFTAAEDGLVKSWKGEVVFCNPPYGSEIKNWVAKAYHESRDVHTTVVMLLPARTDTKYFHKYIYNQAREIRFIKGRLHFGESKNAAPFPSMVVIF